jgi:manganese/zinc/iron transport system substrate-binding protein
VNDFNGDDPIELCMEKSGGSMNKIGKIALIVLCTAAIITVVLLVVLNLNPKQTVQTPIETEEPQPVASPRPTFPPVSNIPYNVVVSTDFVRELTYMFAKSRTNKAITLVKAGVDPLTYLPTEADERTILKSDLFIYIGLGLEPGIEKLVEKLEGRARCVALGPLLDSKLLIKSDAYPSGYDPHIWWGLDVWEKLLLQVTKVFAEVDPEGEFDYVSVYQRYGESTSLLNHRYMQIWSSYIPKERRVIVTIHPAFTYFARLYDYKTESVYHPYEQTYTRERIEEIADYVIKNNVPAIFYELEFPHKPIDEIAAVCSKKGYTVKIGGTLYSYSLGADMDKTDYRYLNAGRFMMQTIYDALKTKKSMEIPK